MPDNCFQAVHDDSPPLPFTVFQAECLHAEEFSLFDCLPVLHRIRGSDRVSLCGYDKHRRLHPFMRHRLCSLSVFQAAYPAISGTETYQRAEAHSVLTHPNFTRLSAIKGGKQQKKNCKFAKHPASLYNENSRAFHAPSRQQTAALFYGSSGG